MTASAPPKPAQCPACGAGVEPDRPLCWLCGCKLKEAASDSQQAASANSQAKIYRLPENDRRPGFSLQSLMLFVTIAAVAIGVFTIAPGLAIPLGIILFLVWIRTAAVVHRRESSSRPVDFADKVRLFLTSFGVAIVLSILLLVAGAVTFFFACLVAISSPSNDFSGVWVAIAVGAVVWLFIAARIVHRRWLQDIDDGS